VVRLVLQILTQWGIGVVGITNIDVGLWLCVGMTNIDWCGPLTPLDQKNTAR
jgi:hypothetical protein